MYPSLHGEHFKDKGLCNLLAISAACALVPHLLKLNRVEAKERRPQPQLLQIHRWTLLWTNLSLFNRCLRCCKGLWFGFFFLNSIITENTNAVSTSRQHHKLCKRNVLWENMYLDTRRYQYDIKMEPTISSLLFYVMQVSIHFKHNQFTGFYYNIICSYYLSKERKKRIKK